MPAIHLTDGIVKGLSTDRAYGYRITQAIQNRELP